MTSFLDTWLSLARTLSRIAVRVAGAVMLLSAALVGFDVIVRKLFAITLGGADELTGYAFVVGTAWALSFTLLERGHVRVDALYSRLPLRVAAILDLVSLVALTTFVGYLTVRAHAVLGDSLLFSTKATTPLATPLWIPQTLWLAGLCLFVFTIVPLTLRVAIALFTGDLAQVRALAGARSLEEDAASESAHTAGLRAAAGEA